MYCKPRMTEEALVFTSRVVQVRFCYRITRSNAPIQYLRFSLIFTVVNRNEFYSYTRFIDMVNLRYNIQRHVWKILDSRLANVLLFYPHLQFIQQDYTNLRRSSVKNRLKIPLCQRRKDLYQAKYELLRQNCPRLIKIGYEVCRQVKNK